MPFYLRKSIAAGPFRFNISKSGLGLSVGVRGLRIGTGPRGHYIRAGANGFYYRASLGRTGQRPRPAPTSDTSTESPQVAPSSGVEMVDIESGDVLVMSDARLDSLLNDINAKLRQVPLSTAIALAVGAAATGAAFLTSSPTAVAIAIALIPVGYAFGSWLDSFKRTVVLYYDLDSVPADAYQRLVAAFEEMASCDRTWHVPAEGQVRDLMTWKRNAGASTLVRRSQVALSLGLPSVVKSNLDPPYLRVGRQALYFFPDFVLVVDGSNAGAVTYEQLDIEVSPVRFIEDGSVPSDAQVIDHTWEHPNKSGGPDRRFARNRQIPVCWYEEVHIGSSTGLREHIHLSKVGNGDGFASAAKALAGYGPVDGWEGKHPHETATPPERSAPSVHRWGWAAFAGLVAVSVATAVGWSWPKLAEHLPKAPTQRKWDPIVTSEPPRVTATPVVVDQTSKGSPKTVAPLLDVTVSISIQGGRKPIVIGRTNLPAGTKLIVMVSRKETSYFAQEKVTVMNGKFRAGPFSRKGVELNAGRYSVEVSSSRSTFQPASVHAVIGQKGENLRGPATKLAFDERVLAFSRNFVIGPGSPP